MAQSQADAIEELRDQLDEQHKLIVQLRGDVDALTEKATAPTPQVGVDGGLRAELDRLKAQLIARFGPSLE